MTNTKINGDELPGMSAEMKKMYEILKRMESVDTTSSSITDFDISDIADGEDENDNIGGKEDDLEMDSDDEQIDKILDRGTSKSTKFISFASDTKNVDSSINDCEISLKTNELSDRMNGIDLNDPSRIWDALTDQEKCEFEKLAANEGIKQYDAWWEKKIEKKLIEDVDPSQQLSEIGVPVILKIKDFASITKKTPADCMRYNIINILAGYTFTVRFYNGLHHDFSVDALATFLKVCGNFKSNLNYEHEYFAIEAVIVDGLSHKLIEDEVDKDLIKTDVSAILAGPYNNTAKSNLFVLAALSDLHQIFNDAKSSIIESGKDVFDKMFLKQCIKKVEYYLSYSNKFIN